jgi:hypothetical protein
MPRLIPVEVIPNSLWSKEDFTLYLPPQLISSWVKLLEKYDLKEKAMTPNYQGFEGGISQEDTDNHLAWRFTGSSARVMLAVLDPLQNLSEISNEFTRLFSGNKVFLADLPCGSGAASLSILSIFCELRKKGIVPRTPIHIVIIGGEISVFAQRYAKEILNYLVNELAEQAITIEVNIIDWDVCDNFSNTELVKKLKLTSQKCSKKLLFIANFSGFLEGDNKWPEANNQFEKLFQYSENTNVMILWIEPKTNKVINNNGFFPRLVKWFRKTFSQFIGKNKEMEDKQYAQDRVKVQHPLVENSIFKTNLAVKKFYLPKKE